MNLFHQSSRILAILIYSTILYAQQKHEILYIGGKIVSFDGIIIKQNWINQNYPECNIIKLNNIEYYSYCDIKIELSHYGLVKIKKSTDKHECTNEIKLSKKGTITYGEKNFILKNDKITNIYKAWKYYDYIIAFVQTKNSTREMNKIDPRYDAFSGLLIDTKNGDVILEYFGAFTPQLWIIQKEAAQSSAPNPALNPDATSARHRPLQSFQIPRPQPPRRFGSAG